MKRYHYSYTLKNVRFAPAKDRRIGFIDASSPQRALAKIKTHYPKRKHITITNW